MGSTRWLATCLVWFGAVGLGSAASADESQFRKPVNCRSRDNGNFVWGCSQFYSICDNGNEVPMECFSDLVLNPKNNFCDRRANVPACKDPSATRNTLYKAKAPFTCDRKRDGQYPKGDCSAEYILCNHGNQQILRCPAGTFYDSKESVCGWQTEIEGCNPDLSSANAEDDGTIVERGQSHLTSHQQPQTWQGQVQPSQGQSQATRGQPQPSPILPGKVKKRIGAQFQYPPYQHAPQAPSVGAPIAQPIRDPAPLAPAPPQQYQKTQQNYASIPQDAPARPIGFDCSQRTDGYYAGQQCAKDYWACAAGKAFQFQCPGTLVFDSTIQGCDYPSECGQPRAITTPAPILRRQVNFDCSARSDGYYTNGPCTKDYYHCLAGTAFGLTCPGTTVFDSITEACDWPQVCGKPRTTAPPANPPPVNSYQQRPSAPAAPPAVVIRPVTFDCSQRTDGIHVDQPCKDHYFSCANGITHQFNCAPGTLFDPNTNACQYADTCGKAPPPAPPAADPPAPVIPAYVDSHGGAGHYFQQQQGYGQQSQQVQSPPSIPVAPSSGGAAPPSAPVAPVPASIDCSRQPDGFYEQGQCQQNYVRCANGLTFAQQCPAGLVFRTDICEFPHECANPAQPTPAAPVATTPPPSDPSGLITTQTSEASCASLTNGNHPVADCSQEYSSCWGGQGVRAKCPGSLFYNPENNFCDFRRNVVGCNPPSADAPAVVPAVVPAAPASYNSGAQLNPPSGTTPAPIQAPSTFCLDNRKPSGFFGEACNSYFFACDASGGTTRFLCPANGGSCNHRELVLACGGQKPITPAPTAPAPGNVALDAGAGYRQPQPPAVQDAPEFSCGTKPPGYYSHGCGSTYYSCAGGIAIALTCPAGLLFSETTQRCDYRNSVPECGGGEPSTPAPIVPSADVPSQPALPPAPQPPQQPQYIPAQAPAPQQSQPSQYVPAQPIVSQPVGVQAPLQQGAPQYSIQPQGPIRQRPGDKNCYGNLNGIYGRPCSRFYYVCHYQRKYEFICPASQVYSPNAGKCVQQELVPSCNKSSPYAGVSPAPILSRRRNRRH